MSPEETIVDRICKTCRDGLLFDSVKAAAIIREAMAEKDAQLTALTQRAEQAERERDEAVPFMLAVKNAHNGYDAAMRNSLHDLEEPATPEQALRELNAELEAMFDDTTDRLYAAEAEAKRLREGLLLCRNELAWLFERTGAKEGGSVWRAYTKADALLAPPPQEAGDEPGK